MNKKVIYKDPFLGNYYLDDLLNFLDNSEEEIVKHIKVLKKMLINNVPKAKIIEYYNSHISTYYNFFITFLEDSSL